MDIGVRQLGVKDVDAYREIRLEALQKFPSAYGSTYGEALARPIKSFGELLENSTMFGIFVDNKLSGIACFVAETGKQNAHIGHLYQMFVRGNKHRLGLGQKLIEAVIAHGKTKVKQIYLGVGTNNQPALALYKKVGFEIYGTEPRALLIDGTYIDEHLMVKYLDRLENT